MNKLLSKITFYTSFILFPTPILALTAEEGAQKARPSDVPSCLFGKYDAATGDCTGAGGIFGVIANILIFLVGAIAVIMLIWGGLQYVISSGDAARVKSAKDTILYGIIGVVVAILAFAIVNFVITQLT
jgi:hypothetical protein